MGDDVEQTAETGTPGPIAPSATEGVTQTILHDPEMAKIGVYGNCLQAAVATLLDRPLDSVPHFSLFLWWNMGLELWARGEGLIVRTEQIDAVPERRCIVGGKSPRGVSHVCIGEGGRIVWDPHPSRAGLTSVDSATWFESWEHPDHECPFCHHDHRIERRLREIHDPEEVEAEVWLDGPGERVHAELFPDCTDCDGHECVIQVSLECGYTHDGEYPLYRPWPCPTVRALGGETPEVAYAEK
jgi:hypothetical protein